MLGGEQANHQVAEHCRDVQASEHCDTDDREYQNNQDFI